MDCNDKTNILDLIIEQGATFYRKIAMTDSDGVVVDLTGASASMQIRADYGGEIIADSTSNITLTITEASGFIEVTIAPTVTAAISYREGKYDVEVTYASGTVERILQGDVVICREVTV